MTEYKFEEVVYLYMVTKDGEPYFYGIQPSVGYPITFRELSGDGAEYFKTVIQQADTIVSYVANEDWVNEQV